MLPPDLKQRVRASFDRAAVTYDSAAVVQRRVCDRLLATLVARSTFDTTPPTHILDAGCGTGYGAGLLRQRWPQAEITGVDFAPAMLGQARAQLSTGAAGDIEHLPFADARFELWWSSLTIQWCDATRVFAEAHRVLRPGGRLALSTLATETFHELRSAFSGIDAHRHTLPFSDPEAIGAALAGAGFLDIELVRERHLVHYPELKTLLRAVKAIGAQNVGEGGRSGMLGKDAWTRVQAAYEAYRTPAGLPASYDVLLYTARRPG